ncbi:MAG TPA: sigma-70 family RNA polymerase sigma factor [Gemmataceae bacterium]|nr:sigma-70 family RNA polymerase sigma factor [Gemmataceae bacterium]
MSSALAPSLRTVEERNALVEQWAGLVPFVLYRSLRGHQGVMLYRHECRSAAHLALLRAAELWREDEGTKFSTYAVVAIRHAVRREVARQARLRAREVPFLLEFDNGDVMERSCGQPRLTEPDGLDDLPRALAGLPPRQRAVIEMRYGLRGTDPLTLEQAGALLGCCRERVRSVESQALRQLIRQLAPQRAAAATTREEKSHAPVPAGRPDAPQPQGVSAVNDQPSPHARNGLAAGEAHPFVPTALQRAILTALDRRALRTDALAVAAGYSRRQLFTPRGLLEMKERGLVAHHPRLGFYRPDAVPPELAVVPAPADNAPELAAVVAGLSRELRRLRRAVRQLTRVAAPAPAAAAAQLAPIRFADDFRTAYWFGETIPLTETHAKVVRVLWEAYRKGTPDVCHDVLIRAAGSEAAKLSDVFKGSLAWGRLIVSSSRGVYRVNDQPATTSPPCDSSNGAGAVSVEHAGDASGDGPGRPASQCVVDILATLEEVGRPLTRTRLLVEMIRQGREWSERTVAGYLARMVEDGTLLNPDGARPPGYRLPEWAEADEGGAL